MHAREMHAREMHAREMHAHEVHVCEMYVYEVHACEMHLRARTFATRLTQNEPPSPPSAGGERGTNLTEIITQQSNTIENVRAKLAEIKSEQQNLKNQNAEL
jgi:hypothetical protein